MIIGITGTDGAGKGAAVRYLVHEKGFTHLSSRALIMKEVDNRGLTADRDTLRLVANDMRRVYGHDVIVQKALEACSEIDCKNAVIESIRAVAEVETLKKNGGVLLAIDANPKLRYARITGRGSASDHVSYEKFLEQEAIEMNDPDPAGMQKATVMQMADYTIVNEGTLAELNVALDAALAELST